MFETWGRLVFRRRWWMLSVSVAVLLASLAVNVVGGTLGEEQSVQTEATRAENLISTQLPSGPPSTGFILVFSSARLSVGDPAFRRAMQTALAPLAAVLRGSIDTPYSHNPAARALISTDRHSAIAQVTIDDSFDNARGYYAYVRSLVHSRSLHVEATGDLAVAHDFDTHLNSGLARSGKVALPLSLLLLLLAFGTIVAAFLPLGIGVLSIVAGSAAALLINRVSGVDPSVTEFISLLGLGLAIDYSLFIVTRFREGLDAGRDVEASLMTAMATAGRAVTFSGLTVMVALAGLFFYRGTWLGTIAGPLVLLVALAVFFALTLLPSVLAILGVRVNALRLPLPKGRLPRGVWHGLASWVMRRPWLVLLPTLGLVLVAASPFTQIDLATDHQATLPPSAESRQGSDIILRSFPRLNQSEIPVVVQYPGGNPLSARRVASLYDLTHAIAPLPDVVAVRSIVTLDARVSRAGYIALYSRPPARSSIALRRGIGESVGKTITTFTVLTNQPSYSTRARDLVRHIRALASIAGGQLLVTGAAAGDVDRTSWILHRTPWAIAFVVGMTFVILLALLGSVVLPVKAVITNLLSISVSFGVMVWVFQQGHLSSLLDFTPGPIDPTLPPMMFCIIFGLSMDYEVFLLSRIQEEYRRTGDNTQAVAYGLERCGRLVTVAAAIMVGVFGSFALGDVNVIKSAGLCTAVAVGVDATLMRGLIVPAAMVLMRRANWWLPHWIETATQRLGTTELSAEEARPA